MERRPADDDVLAHSRQHLDEIDDQIVQLLIERVEIIRREIIPIKEEKGIQAHQPQRFAQLLERLKERAAKEGLDPQLVEEIWIAIHAHSLAEEKTKLKD